MEEKECWNTWELELAARARDERRKVLLEQRLKRDADLYGWRRKIVQQVDAIIAKANDEALARMMRDARDDY